MQTNDDLQGDPVVVRAWRLVEEIRQRPDGIRLTELSRKTDMPPGTVHRMLRQWESCGVLEQTIRRLWKLGPAFLAVSETK